jgi:hypothetical protein
MDRQMLCCQHGRIYRFMPTSSGLCSHLGSSSRPKSNHEPSRAGSKDGMSWVLQRLYVWRYLNGPRSIKYVSRVADPQGSGKTLAYSLPILSHLLHQSRHTTTRRPLSGLVLCPTRELALQVVDHLQKLVKYIEAAMYPDEEEMGPASGAKAKRVPRISIGSVVGGLSAHKQKRIVERGADVLVATPGRLWDLIKSVSGNDSRIGRAKQC